MNRVAVALTFVVLLVAAVACADEGQEVASNATPEAALNEVDVSGESFALALNPSSVFSFHSASKSTEVDRDAVSACEAAIAQNESYRYRLNHNASFPNAAQLSQDFHVSLERRRQQLYDEYVAEGTPEDDASRAAQWQADYEDSDYERSLRGWDDSFQGEFKSPGRWHVTPGNNGHDETIAVHDRYWNKDDGVWSLLLGGTTEDLYAVAPPFAVDKDYCDNVTALVALESAEASKEVLRDVSVTRFHLGTEAVNDFIAAQPKPPGEPDETGIPFSDASLDIWLDFQSYLILRFDFTGQQTIPSSGGTELDEAFYGAVWGLETFSEIFDINDPSISIEPPI